MSLDLFLLAGVAAGKNNSHDMPAYIVAAGAEVSSSALYHLCACHPEASHRMDTFPTHILVLEAGDIVAHDQVHGFSRHTLEPTPVHSPGPGCSLDENKKAGPDVYLNLEGPKETGSTYLRSIPRLSIAEKSSLSSSLRSMFSCRCFLDVLRGITQMPCMAM